MNNNENKKVLFIDIGGKVNKSFRYISSYPNTKMILIRGIYDGQDRMHLPLNKNDRQYEQLE